MAYILHWTCTIKIKAFTFAKKEMHSFMSYPEIQHFFKDFTKTSDANVLVFRHRHARKTFIFQ